MVSFYLTTLNNLSDVLIIICKIINKAYAKHLNIAVITPSTTITKELSDKLYSFQPEAFIPHTTIIEELPQFSILLTTTQPKNNNFDIIINLQDKPIIEYKKYNKIIELVYKDNKDLSRRKYSYYQTQALTIKTINIK